MRSVVCNHSCCVCPEHVHLPKVKLSLPHSLFSSTILLFCLHVGPLWVLQFNGIIQYFSFGPWLISLEHNVLKAQLCHNVYQKSYFLRFSNISLNAHTIFYLWKQSTIAFIILNHCPLLFPYNFHNILCMPVMPTTICKYLWRTNIHNLQSLQPKKWKNMLILVVKKQRINISRISPVIHRSHWRTGVLTRCAGLCSWRSLAQTPVWQCCCRGTLCICSRILLDRSTYRSVPTVPLTASDTSQAMGCQ